MARKLRALYRITPLQIIADAYPSEAEEPEGWHVIDDDVQNQDELTEAIFEAIAAKLPNELMTLQASTDSGGIWQVYLPEEDLIPAPDGIWVARKELPGYAREAAWVNDSTEAARRIDLDSLVRARIARILEQDASEMEAALRARDERLAEYRRESGIVDVEPELWGLETAARFIGAASTKSASRTLSRWGVRAVDHPVGSDGRARARFRADDIRNAKANRPGRGARTDLQP